MLDLIEKNIEMLRQLCIKYEVKTMYLFGSAAQGSFKEDSDIDILINFKDIPFDRYTENFFELHSALENLFQRKVDLITEPSLNNSYLIKSIQHTKQLLYAA
jgi:predicted nucleotidyltransferase